MSFSRATGLRRVRVMTAGVAVAEGDLVQTDETTGSSTVIAAATNIRVAGITQAAAGIGDSVSVDFLAPGDEVNATVSTGTVSATSLYKFADIASATGITLTPTNNDARVVGWNGKTTTEAVVVFPRLEVVA